MGQEGDHDEQDRHRRVDQPGPLFDTGRPWWKRRLWDPLRRPVLVLALGHGGMVAPPGICRCLSLF
jgi:hypothetical protein